MATIPDRKAAQHGPGRRIALVMAVVAAIVLLSATAALAYYLAAGTGTGSGSAGTMQTVTAAAVTGTPTTPLVPGGTGDVLLKVSNPNGFSVSLSGVSFKSGGTITFDAGHGSCTTTDSSPVVTLSVPGADLPQSIGANATASFDLANAVTMDSTASSSCQGATIYIPVTITVQS